MPEDGQTYDIESGGSIEIVLDNLAQNGAWAKGWARLCRQLAAVAKMPIDPVPNRVLSLGLGYWSLRHVRGLFLEGSNLASALLGLAAAAALSSPLPVSPLS